ncbi:MAG TPA: GldG family protein [Nitrosospira sp.]
MAAADDKLRMRRLAQNGLFVVSLISLAVLLGYLAAQTRTQWDISQNGRNSLSPASVDVLKKLDGPVRVAVYATARDAQLGNVRGLIEEFLLPYRRVKPDFTVIFVDPAEQPGVAQEAGVQVNGEMVVEFNGRREHLATFNEQALTNLLMRMARQGERHVMALAGHGERRLDGIASRELGEFGKYLMIRGFKNGPINLAVAPDVPRDASVLIISSPQTDLPEGEVEKLLAYIARGGNLLWLLDQGPLRGLQPLAEKLDLTLTPGVVIDPQAQQLKMPVTFALGASYGHHPVTRNFDYITVFPFARQITVNENEEWQSVSLVESAQSGWVETGKLDAGVAFEEAYDVSGPVSLAVALSRTVQDREQRVAVIGSSHFLSNNYLGYGKNLDFGMNLVNWLAGDENLISVPSRVAPDGNLVLSETAQFVITAGFLIILPLTFFASGAVIWWRRRKR